MQSAQLAQLQLRQFARLVSSSYIDRPSYREAFYIIYSDYPTTADTIGLYRLASDYCSKLANYIADQLHIEVIDK
jgi:hypothetical protein